MYYKLFLLRRFFKTIVHKGGMVTIAAILYKSIAMGLIYPSIIKQVPTYRQPAAIIVVTHFYKWLVLVTFI